MIYFRNDVPRHVTNISYNCSGGIDLELNCLTQYQIQRVFDALNDKDTHNFNLDNIKIIFSGPKTICIDKKTGRKTMITYSQENQVYMDKSSRISLVLIKHILYGQKRKKEYTRLCSKLHGGLISYVYLQGLIGTDNVDKIFDRLLQETAEPAQ